MQIIYKDDKFYCLCSFANKDIPKRAGFRWSPEQKVWWTDRKDIAGKLVTFADAEAKAVLDQHINQVMDNIAASKAKTADIDPPHPQGLEYMPFQKAGVAFACKLLGIPINRNDTMKGTLPIPSSGVLIADEMGLG